MANFLIGLQFLTRIRLMEQTEWSAERFGKSVKYFTLIGAVLGMLLASMAVFFYFLLPHFGIYPPPHFTALFLVAAGIFLTGGLHCDGFMDTMDGIFSGRSRQRMLEIMKDSCVGANGACGFSLLLLSKWSLLLDQTPEKILVALFLMPILGRLSMVLGITFFPYARPEGIGKAFAQYANKTSFYIACGIALFFVLIAALLQASILPLVAMSLSLCFATIFARYVTRILGGLTGDVYGAMTELSELLVLLVFLL